MTHSTSVERRRGFARPALRRSLLLLASGLALLPAVPSAAETITYTYDAKGRLTQAAHAGGPANGATTTYQFDAADNRTSVSTTGAPGAIVVVPLNGISVIPLRPSG